jgi:hypothetical protein
MNIPMPYIEETTVGSVTYCEIAADDDRRKDEEHVRRRTRSEHMETAG